MAARPEPRCSDSVCSVQTQIPDVRNRVFQALALYALLPPRARGPTGCCPRRFDGLVSAVFGDILRLRNVANTSTRS